MLDVQVGQASDFGKVRTNNEDAAGGFLPTTRHQGRTLGYLLAVMSGSVTYFSRDYSLTRFPILIPLFVLAIPLFDAFSVVVIRLYHHKPIYIGDHNHLSHRFVKMGMSRKRAVQMVHLMALIIGLSVLPLLWGDYKIDVVILAQAILMLLFMSMIQYAVYQDHGKSTDQDQAATEKPETPPEQE